MFKRPLFWLGLLLGAFAAFRILFRKPADTPGWLLDLYGDAVVLCDQAGNITQANGAAQALFGPDGAGLTRLCYLTGQRVPPGQLPHTFPRQAVTEYRITSNDGTVRVLDVRTKALPGGSVAFFRDATLRHKATEREERVQRGQEAVAFLCRRLAKAETAEEIARASAESVRLLLNGLPDTQVRLYGYDTASQTVTRLASDPEDRPKHPKSAAEALPPAFPFDARIPALWQLYISRQPVFEGLPQLGEGIANSAQVLPLLAHGMALGHLSLTSASGEAFDDPDLRGTLDTLASLTALALAVPLTAGTVSALESQADALRDIAQAVSKRPERDRLADLVTSRVRHVTPCQVCTLSILIDGNLTALGDAVQDDLLYPEHFASNDKALHGKAVRKAWRIQKTVSQSGIQNPEPETGPWRAFAGTSGRHSLCAVPLASRLGVLTIYSDGALPLPDAQIKFLETVAVLASIGLNQATVPEAGAEC